MARITLDGRTPDASIFARLEGFARRTAAPDRGLGANRTKGLFGSAALNAP